MIEYTVRVYENGTRFWLLDDDYHREDGPAIVWADGYTAWFLNGDLHREDGPAIEGANGACSWYLRGEPVTQEEHRRRTQPVKELTVAEVEQLLGYSVKIVK